ncbi:hypothetical protein WJX72_008510 [[Myrmecia] bisecta]|uniref:Uncharacterized protein n=1 Tax=[Myrmecia] bisecta TaxID=41462 RepID=A0AAW1Q372_9CHLO
MKSNASRQRRSLQRSKGRCLQEQQQVLREHLPHISYLAASWQLECERADKQLKYAQGLCELYPENSPAGRQDLQTWSGETRQTVAFYERVAQRQRDELRQILAEQRQVLDALTVTQQQLQHATTEMEQETCTLAELKAAYAEVQQRYYLANFAHGWMQSATAATAM